MIIQITPKAEEYFTQLLSTQAPNTKIRVFVSNPGTPGVECGILYCPQNQIKDNDDIFDYNGFQVAIDKTSQPYLENSIIDFVYDKDDKGTLTFKAPKLKRLDVPNDATLFEKLDCFFRTTVNPNLANHGGHADLVSVTDDGIVTVKFSGGCKGCSMVNLTLKDGIEANLKQAFPNMIKYVINATEHEVTQETLIESSCICLGKNEDS